MLSCKEFDERLKESNFEELERESQGAIRYFENLNDEIKCDQIEAKFPAFCLFNKELRIKFPTYKIRIINNENSYSRLEELLTGIGNYKIYEEAYIVKVPSLEPVQSTAIHCLETSLEKNTRIAEEIEEILHENNICTQRCVTSGHYCISIEVNDEGYVTVI